MVNQTNNSFNNKNIRRKSIKKLCLSCIRMSYCRWIASTMAMCMMLMFLPSVSMSVKGDNVFSTSSKRIMKGVTGLESPMTKDGPHSKQVSYTPSDYLYFGMYKVPEVNKNLASTVSSPIKWRILDDNKTSNGKEGMFLLAEYALDMNVNFGDPLLANNVWQGSMAQDWCTKFVTNGNFTPVEQRAMLKTTKTDDKFAKFNYYYDSGTANTYYSQCGECKIGYGKDANEDKAFFLSVEEFANYVKNYEGNDNAFELKVENTSNQSAGVWWLRSPFDDGELVAADKDTSKVETVHGDGHILKEDVSSEFAVRPACNLDLNAILFTSAAVDGKPRAVGSNKISLIDSYTDQGNEWKATVLDKEGHGTFQLTNAAWSGDKLTVTYKGAQKGSNEYISAIIEDEDGKYSHYGKVSKAANKGSVTLNLQNVDLTGKKLYLFNEQCNEDRKTDLSSELIPVIKKIDGIKAVRLNLKEADKFFVKSADGSEYGIGDVNKVFEDGSWFWVREVEYSDDTSSEYYSFLSGTDNSIKKKIEDNNIAIVLMGMIYADGVTDYDRNFKDNRDIDLFIDVSDLVDQGYDHNDIQVMYINMWGEDTEFDETHYTENGKEYVHTRINHFSPYAVYDKYTKEEAAADAAALKTGDTRIMSLWAHTIIAYVSLTVCATFIISRRRKNKTEYNK